MDNASRRALLAVRPWRHGHSVLITIDGTINGPHGPTRVTLDYVPDRLALDHPSVDGWLAGFDPLGDLPADELALAVLGDVDDVLVPRHVRVVLRHGAVRVAVENHQPSWTDHALAHRLRVD